MRIKVKVVPKAHENIVQKIDNETYIVRITSVPEKGKANKSVIKLLADYFDVAKSSVHLLKGKTSKNKIIEIDLK